jgi:hypothetical protein
LPPSNNFPFRHFPRLRGSFVPSSGCGQRPPPPFPSRFPPLFVGSPRGGEHSLLGDWSGRIEWNVPMEKMKVGLRQLWVPSPFLSQYPSPIHEALSMPTAVGPLF